MSRVGKKPIPIPTGVQVSVADTTVRMKGSQGELKQALPPGIRAEVRGADLHVLRDGDNPRARAFHGLARSLVANGIRGVAQKFERKLEIVGIGYRANLEGKRVTFSLGYSHPIEYPIPEGIEILVDKQTALTVRGIDKQKVGQVAAEIRDLRRPGVYKGKGVRYEGERVRQKVGKSGGK